MCLKYTANKFDVLDLEMCCAKKVETSVSSNKITAFCNNEKVESLVSTAIEQTTIIQLRKKRKSL